MKMPASRPPSADDQHRPDPPVVHQPQRRPAPGSPAARPPGSGPSPGGRSGRVVIGRGHPGRGGPGCAVVGPGVAIGEAAGSSDEDAAGCLTAGHRVASMNVGTAPRGRRHAADPVRQAAAIPVRDGRVCLVTSRSGRRWVIPKGQIDPGHTPGGGGPRSRRGRRPGWSARSTPSRSAPTTYEKYGQPHHVIVFVMQVTEEQDDWPERAIRDAGVGDRRGGHRPDRGAGAAGRSAVFGADCGSARRRLGFASRDATAFAHAGRSASPRPTSGRITRSTSASVRTSGTSAEQFPRLDQLRRLARLAASPVRRPSPSPACPRSRTSGSGCRGPGRPPPRGSRTASRTACREFRYATQPIAVGQPDLRRPLVHVLPEEDVPRCRTSSGCRRSRSTARG